MSINVQGYMKTTTAPWGTLFYRLVWTHIDCERKRILDFGSGLGITANHLAANNEVIAVEPNGEMIENRVTENSYTQIQGSVSILAEFPDQSFDVIVCHNVLEYTDSRKQILNEFVRLLRPDGFVSIIKHHRQGKIMQKVVFENNIDEAMKLLQNEDVASVNFGTISEYEEFELETDSDNRLKIENIYGLRTFYALQQNEWKYEDDWQEKMYQMERAVESAPAFKAISFFHHIILKKRNYQITEHVIHRS